MNRDYSKIQIFQVVPFGPYRRRTHQETSENEKIDHYWVGSEGGFVVRWGLEDFGFGELTFYLHEGKLVCDTECMSRDFVRAALNKIADTITIECEKNISDDKRAE